MIVVWQTAATSLVLTFTLSLSMCYGAVVEARELLHEPQDMLPANSPHVSYESKIHEYEEILHTSDKSRPQLAQPRGSSSGFKTQSSARGLSYYVTVPEPSSFLLVAGGLGLYLFRRYR